MAEIEINKLRQENEALRKIAVDLHWMARRYADGRQSYATSLFNEHTRKLLEFNIKLNETGDHTIWARDGGGRAFDGLTNQEAGMGEKPEWTWSGIERENEKLRVEIEELKKKI